MFSLEQESAASWEEKAAQLKGPRNSQENSENGLEKLFVFLVTPSSCKYNELLQDRHLPVDSWSVSELSEGSLELATTLVGSNAYKSTERLKRECGMLALSQHSGDEILISGSATAFQYDLCWIAENALAPVLHQVPLYLCSQSLGWL